MEKDFYFSLSFRDKCQYIETIRKKLYEAETIEQRDSAIPKWLIVMLLEFEKEHFYNKFSSIFLGSLLITTCYTMDEEFVCILDEIESEILQITIQQLEKNIEFSWANRYKKENY